MEAQSLPGAELPPNNAPLIPIAAVTSEVASSVPSQYRSQVASLYGTVGGSSDLPAGFVPRGHRTDTGGEKNVSKSPESAPQIPGSVQLAPIKPQDTFRACNRPQFPPIGSAGDLDLSSVSTFSPLSGLVPWDGLKQSQGLSGVQSQECAGRTGQKRPIEWEEVSHGGGGDQTEAKRRRQSVQLEAPDWLPPGWTVVARTRDAGRSAGTTDKVFASCGKSNTWQK